MKKFLNQVCLLLKQHRKKLIVMRNTVLILLVSALQVFATGSYAQTKTISLAMNDATIREVLYAIQNQSEFYFLYNSELIDVTKKVDITIEKEKVDAILTRLFNKNEVDFLIKDRYIILTPVGGNAELFAEQQQNTVSGKVADSDNQPLPGVTVVVKGTTQGTVTNADGNYSLSNIPEDATLQFSFVGMRTQEVVVGGQTTINVEMVLDAIGIEEVVAIGYGSMKKANLTGAVSAIEGDELVNRPVSGTTESLQGAIPGVVVTRSSGSPGDEGFDIQIRGITSANGSSPLVLIDGIEGDIENIRPEDIESISALKDAAAASIYGSRAAGGVILVTTKKGKAGDITVNYNAYYSLLKLARRPQRIDSWKKAELVNLSRTNAGASPPVSEDVIAKLKDPNINWEPDASYPNEYHWYGNYDYEDMMLYDFSSLKSHNISISGGNQHTTYRISGTYFNNDGFIKVAPDENTKYNTTLNLETRINKHITFSNILYYSENQIEKPFHPNLEDRWGLFERIYIMIGDIPLYDPNGNITEGNSSLGWGNEGRLAWYSKEAGRRDYDKHNLRFNSTLTIKDLVKGLEFRIKGVLDRDFNTTKVHRTWYGYYGIDGTLITPPTGGEVERSYQNDRYREFQFLTDYDLDLDNHNFHFLAAFAFNDFRREVLSASATGLVNQGLPSFDWTDPISHSIGDNIATNATQSVFGRVNYNFAERYLFEANLRYDGSSKLSPEDRYRLFPSLSAGWRVSEENWFNVPFISQAKIRGSWGQLGNADILGNYGFIGLLRTGENVILGDNGSATSYIFENTLASQNVTWETIETSNVGLDLVFLDDQLAITGDYFVKRNIDMLAGIAYPSVIGVNTPSFNVGEMKTWGWEASLTWRDNVDRFSYWISANISDAQNEMIEYLGADVFEPGVVRLLNGYPMNTIWGYETDGYFQTQDEVDAHAFQDNRTGPGDVKFVNQNDDDRINTGEQTAEDHGDLVNLGNTNPRYNYGIQAGFNWNSIDFSVFFQGVGKRYFILDEAEYPFYFGGRFPHSNHLDYWTPENQDALWPRIYVNGRHRFAVPSDKYVQNASYIRLKDLQIGYTLPERWMRSVGVQKLRIYFAGRDLWEKTKTFDFIDPERSGATYMYPFSRKYTLGLNLTF